MYKSRLNSSTRYNLISAAIYTAIACVWAFIAMGLYVADRVLTPKANGTTLEHVETFTGTHVPLNSNGAGWGSENFGKLFVCKDGTVSEAKHRIGACYMHGGIDD